MTQTIPEEQTKLHHIFADETCQTGHMWMVIGSLIVADEHLNHVRAKFLAMKKHMGIQGEIKWEYTNTKLLPRYKRLANAAFGLIEKGIMQFHSLTICMDVVDDDKYNDGSPDLGFAKFIHHLLLKYGRIIRARTSTTCCSTSAPARSRSVSFRMPLTSPPSATVGSTIGRFAA
jgi:hypothetical protein